MPPQPRIRKQSQDDHTTLPQFLLRGFVFREPHGKRRHNCVYQFTSEDREGDAEHIGKVSTALDFFGRPGEREVESKLSGDETRCAPLIATLRTGSSRVVSAHSIPLVASFVTHFLRSANVRYQLTRYAECYFTLMAKELTTDAIDSMLANVYQRLTIAAERVEEKYRHIALASIQAGREGAIKKAESLVRGARDIRHFGFDHEMIRERHLDQIEGEFGSLPLAQGLNRWAWAVENAAPDSFVLGDVGPVASYEGVPDLHPLFTLARPGSLTAIWVPIAHDRVLIGWSQGAQPRTDPEALNSAAAEASRSQFVAHAKSTREVAYAHRIGSRFYEPDVEQLREDFRSKIRKAIGLPAS